MFSMFYLRFCLNTKIICILFLIFLCSKIISIYWLKIFCNLLPELTVLLRFSIVKFLKLSTNIILRFQNFCTKYNFLTGIDPKYSAYNLCV